MSVPLMLILFQGAINATNTKAGTKNVNTTRAYKTGMELSFSEGSAGCECNLPDAQGESKG